MTRLDRIRRLVELKALEEMLAAKELAQSRQQLEQGQKTHAELVDFTRHYENLDHAAGRRKQASSWTRQRHFAQKLGQAIEQQLELINQHEEVVKAYSEHWRKKRSRYQATETLLDKIHEQELKRLDRISAAEMDEMAHLRARKPNR